MPFVRDRQEFEQWLHGLLSQPSRPAAIEEALSLLHGVSRDDFETLDKHPEDNFMVFGANYILVRPEFLETVRGFYMSDPNNGLGAEIDDE